MSTRTRKSVEVASYLIYKNNNLPEDGTNTILKSGFSNKKLQKMLYFAQAWYLAIYDKELFPDDFEAWIHGPAIRHVYGLYKNFGYSRINLIKNNKDFSSLTEKEKGFLDMIFEIYHKFDAQHLEFLSHNDTPWIDARNETPPNFASLNVISKESIKVFYKEKLSALKQDV